jgi:hypothetical protein
VRSRPGLIIKMGGEIRCGWRRETHSVVGVDRQLVAGVRVTVEHEHPAFIEREFWSLCRLRRPLQSGFAFGSCAIALWQCQAGSLPAHQSAGGASASLD